MPEPPRTDAIVYPPGPADLTGMRVTELVQPPKPHPYLLPRPSGDGYRASVFIYPLGPGGTVGVGGATRQRR